MAKTSKAHTVLKIVGGINHRIGANCSVIEHVDKNGNTNIVMFDLGSIFTPYETGFVAAFPNVDEYFDRVDPKTHEEIKAIKHVDYLCFTHAHEDHVGALINYVKMGYKLPPIKASSFTRNFIRLAFKAEGLPEPNIEKIKPGEVIRVSDNMQVQAVAVSHSIAEPLGFYTTTYDDGKQCAAIMNNGDFLTEEEMPIGPSFNKETYINTLKSSKTPVIMCLDSTSTSPHGSERIGFDKAVENTYNVIQKHSSKSIIISPVISRSVENIAIDIEVARKLGTKVCLDGKWLSLVKDAMSLSGYKDFDDVIYKGTLNAYLNDDKIKKKYIVCTGAFAQGLENYEYNVGVDDISPIPMASATKMALDLHPNIRIGPNCLVVARQRIIEEINGKTGPKMLQMLAAQGATVVMSPSSKPVGNFEQVKMQDSGHANATAMEALMVDVKREVGQVIVIPIHGNPEQCEDTANIMKKVGVPTYMVGNHEGIYITDGKITNIENKLTPITWYAARAISYNPFSERDIPLEGLKEFWEVTEDYQPIRKVCEVENTHRFTPRDHNYSNAHSMIEKAEDMPKKETMRTSKAKGSRKRKKQEQKQGFDIVSMVKMGKGKKR